LGNIGSHVNITSAWRETSSFIRTLGTLVRSDLRMMHNIGMDDRTVKSKQERTIGRELNERWSVGARQARYRKNGNWFHLLDQFPGALFDENGYILFNTQQDYEQCAFLQRGKELGVPHGIESIPGYVRIGPVANRKLGIGTPDLDAIIAELSRQAPGHQFGALQTIRAEIKSRPLPKSPSAHKIFGRTHQDPHGDYAFHFRGGSESQFNIGFESGNREIRHGIAFSFEPSRNKPWPELRAAFYPR
jgi:hypothetical protein